MLRVGARGGGGEWLRSRLWITSDATVVTQAVRGNLPVENHGVSCASRASALWIIESDVSAGVGVRARGICSLRRQDVPLIG